MCYYPEEFFSNSRKVLKETQRAGTFNVFSALLDDCGIFEAMKRILIGIGAALVLFVAFLELRDQLTATGDVERVSPLENAPNDQYSTPDSAPLAAATGQIQPAASGNSAPPAPKAERSYQLSKWPDATIDRDPDLGTPHSIRRRGGFLSPAAPGVEPNAIIGAFIRANARTMTLHPSDLEPPHARVVQNYTTKHNGVQHVRWQQQRDGLDIFGAHLTVNLTRKNEIINISSRALYMPSVQFHEADNIDQANAIEIAREELGGGDIRNTYVIRQVWYPLDMISCVKSWEVAIEVEGNHEACDFVIRADTGKIVFNQSLTWGAQDITLNVFTDDSPVPITPGPDTPTNFTPLSASRQILTFSALNTNASPQGWIPDGSNELLGNNADVYADWNDDSLPDSPRLTGFPFRVFDRSVSLAQHPTNYTAFSQVQAFYWANFMHDRLYALGFDEPSGNFQQDNFGFGGTGGDRLKIEVQNGYSLGFSSANQSYYTGFGDGTEGKVTVSLFSRSSPLRDGAIDGQLVLHEATHGLTSRLIGNGYGLTTVQPRGMAEGWSDYFALSLLSKPSDPINAVYPFGNYAAMYSTPTSNLYFGIRRYPYSTDMTKAPQTLADTDPNQIAFPTNVPRNHLFGSEEADQVHNIGEVWCLALWECRANLLTEYGFPGNDLMEQLVVDGLKLTPDNPRFDQARDAILQADVVDSGGSNSIALWRGFAKRGLGYSAWIPEPTSTVGIQEAFDLPFAVTVTVVEVVGDGDSCVEPGEPGQMEISLTSHELDLSGVIGTLATMSSNITITSSNTSFADISVGTTGPATAPFVFEAATNFPGFTDAIFTLRIASDKGWFEYPVAVRIGNPYDYAPEILDVCVTNITETNAWVYWTTGIPSTGRVFYGMTTNYGATAWSSQPMGTNHFAELTNLLKGTTYHFQIEANGTNGLTGLSPDMTFRSRARIYVYADSPATQELGTVNAPFKSLQAAAEVAKITGDEILVAVGVYTGSNPEAVLNLDGAGYDLTIYGGYSPDFAERDLKWYETVIDGQYQRRGIRLDNGAALSISGVTVTKGSHEWGGGVSVRKSGFSGTQVSITDCFATNGNFLGGGLYATLGSQVLFSDGYIASNVAVQGGGVFIVSAGTKLTLSNARLEKNSATLVGGGIMAQLSGEVECSDSLIIRNVSEFPGGGIAIFPFSTGVVVGCTISWNVAIATNNPDLRGGGGILVSGPASRSYLTIRDSVVFANTGYTGSDLLCSAQAETHATHSNIGDIYGNLTTSNNLINADPIFANADTGDVHLLYGSPCIDSGTPDYSSGGTDIDGEPRPFGSRVDMGADEFTDTDGDHMADYWETIKFGNLTASDGTINSDADDLTDFQEYLQQTDPLNADTDGDGASDSLEVTLGMNPLNPDQDSDGMADGWENVHGLDWETNDSTLDPDLDGMNNLSEYLADTDPFDDQSFLGLLNIGELWGGWRVDWKGGTDALQMLDYASGLNATDIWMTVVACPPPTPVTNAVVVFGIHASNAVFRIRSMR